MGFRWSRVRIPPARPDTADPAPPLAANLEGDSVDKPDPKQQTLRIVIDEQVAQGEFVNFANSIHSPSEFVIDLGRIVPGRADVKVYSRVIMTPLHAKQLLEALAQNISLFEQKFGEIRVENAQQ